PVIFTADGHGRALHALPTRRSSDLSDRILKRLRLMQAHSIVRRDAGAAGVPLEMDRDGRIIGAVPLRVRPADDLRHVLSAQLARDRKSTRLNSSHVKISYAVL